MRLLLFYGASAIGVFCSILNTDPLGASVNGYNFFAVWDILSARGGFFVCRIFQR